MNLKSLTHKLWQRSPADNLKYAKAKFGWRGSVERNDMLDPLLALSSFPAIAAWCLAKLPETELFLFGDARTIESWQIEKILTDKSIHVRNWTWGDKLDSGRIVICRPPFSAEHWAIIWKANAEAIRITTLGELIAPFLQIPMLMNRLDYYFQSVDEVIPIYLGQEFFGPLKELDASFPLKGKAVIEFGCFDGYQSLGLCHLGAKLTCLEARADNVVKTRAALNAVGFDARIVMDDFHNAHASRYGRFDLAFAHGVYYHSVAPFVFFENLISLSDHIFLGGFCATEDLPSTPWSHLEYQGRTYRAKNYVETIGFTAGVNNLAWFFHKEDFVMFFTERDFEVTVISDEPSNETAGNFTRFLASKATR